MVESAISSLLDSATKFQRRICTYRLPNCARQVSGYFSPAVTDRVLPSVVRLIPAAWGIPWTNQNMFFKGQEMCSLLNTACNKLLSVDGAVRTNWQSNNAG